MCCYIFKPLVESDASLTGMLESIVFKLISSFAIMTGVVDDCLCYWTITKEGLGTRLVVLLKQQRKLKEPTMSYEDLVT